ncbi:MAG: DNA repair protein RecN [Paludibacteraceae bacterium]|nr:DNA repair protein RecN [Paludibacteraceae bacterium]MBQ9100922.1 DNA repair protein RecN [Paludibacteraceae bacterium]MBR6658629.1 DNA repair protein RecN [Paludibacteraceae bacterium]
MLKSLTVENYALIEKSEIFFNEGFSVITGETGSGKSILLDALGLILGQRADQKTLKDPSRKCVVEAIFDLKEYDLISFFESEELEYDDETVIRREVLPSGKSRAFVNDSPVALNSLKELAGRLIDIHSQHANLLLAESSFQLQVVDAVADNSAELAEYKELFTTYVQLQRELKILEEQSVAAESDRDYLEYQLSQLKELSLKEIDQVALEEELSYLTHATEIKEAIEGTAWLLNGKDDNILSELKSASQILSGVSTLYPKVSEWAERINSVMIEMKDVARDLEQEVESVEVNPNRLESVEKTLDKIYAVEKKHHLSSVQELIELQEDFENKLEQIGSYSERITTCKEQIKSIQEELSSKSAILSEKRTKAVPSLEQSMNRLLVELGIVNARFKVQIDRAETFLPTGEDCITFMFSANKSVAERALHQIASGGEMSRVMLALKCILSRNVNLPTILLDEIDTGVSGEVATRMAMLMQQMGEFMQVISITHLPQIAAKGDAHYKVYKEDGEQGTISHIKALSKEERELEIAQMLSGLNPTEAAKLTAKELLIK